LPPCSPFSQSPPFLDPNQSTQASIHADLATMDTKQEPAKDSVGKLKPVLQLRVHKFRETPETTFPLYPGFNKVGRNPDNSTVWLPMPFISACHVTIGIHSLNHFPFLLVCAWKESHNSPRFVV
jgi:hypothetical protein